MSKARKLGLGLVTALIAIVVLATPALAIALPDSTPTVLNVYVYRNILETGDMGFFIYENTPYASTPTTTYNNAFIWRLIDTDGTTELAQAVGYPYRTSGYGYNVIHFYLNAANVTAKGIAWQDLLFLRLSGTPVAFATPPVYNFSISVNDYSTLTDTDDVKLAIADNIRTIGADLYVRWALTSATTLLDDSETNVVLSILGQSFFRGAIYGVQAMAPSVFPLVISNVNVTPRTWSDSYAQALAAQHSGQALGNAFTAGRNLLAVNYNLLGLLLVLGMCVALIIGNWMISGSGMLWRGAVDSAALLPIAARIGLLGFGELGLIAAVCWIYVSAKVWRMI